MYCKHCGKPIDDDSTFCRHCGKQQVGDKSSTIENEPKPESKESKKVQPKKKKQEKNNSRNAIIIFCAGLIVLMAIIVLVICKFHDVHQGVGFRLNVVCKVYVWQDKVNKVNLIPLFFCFYNKVSKSPAR